MGILTTLLKSSLPSMDDIKKTLNETLKAANDTFEEAMEELEGKYSELRQRVRIASGKYICTVPYDRNIERLSYSLEGDVLRVTVSGENSNKETTFTLPPNVLAENASHEYDSNENQMVFMFKVADSNDDNETKLEVDVSDEASKNLAEVLTESFDKVKQAVALHSNGWSFRKIAREIGVSDKTVARWVRNATK